MLWAVLACVAIFHTGGYYWNHLEPCGTPRILLDVPYPQYLNCMAALVCRSRPPFIHFIPMLWRLLACIAILPTTNTIGTTTNHLKPSGNYTTLEPPGTYTTLGFSWMCPTPSTWNVWLHWCAGPPPFHTFYSHALGCVGVDLPYPQNLCVTIFTHSPYYWKLLEPPGTYTTLGFSWICPTSSTYALSFSLLETIGTTWNLYDPRILLDLPYPQYLCVTIFPTTGNYWNHLEPIRP